MTGSVSFRHMILRQAGQKQPKRNKNTINFIRKKHPQTLRYPTDFYTVSFPVFFFLMSPNKRVNIPTVPLSGKWMLMACYCWSFQTFSQFLSPAECVDCPGTFMCGSFIHFLSLHSRHRGSVGLSWRGPPTATRLMTRLDCRLMFILRAQFTKYASQWVYECF